MSQTLTGICLALISASVGALAHALGKKALDYGLTIPGFLALRSVSGVLTTGIVFVVLGVLQGWPTVTLSAIGLGIILGFCHPVLSNLFYFGGLKGSDLSVMSPLINTSALFTTILAMLFLHERPPLMVHIALGIIIIGAVIVPLSSAMHTSRSAHVDSARRSAVLGLGSALAVAIYLVIGKHVLKEVDTRLVVLLICITGAIVFPGFALARRREGLVDRHRKVHMGKAVACTIGSAVIVYSVCSFLSLIAVKLIGASLTACLVSSNVAFGLIFSVILIHEKPSRTRCLGSILVVVGCVICSLARA